MTWKSRTEKGERPTPQLQRLLLSNLQHLKKKLKSVSIIEFEEIPRLEQFAWSV